MKKYLFISFLLLFTFKLRSNHIVGGELELVYVSEFTYNLNLIMYFDRYQNGQNPPPNPGPEGQVTVYVYGNSSTEVLDIFTLNLSSDDNVLYTNQECAIGELATSRPFYTLEVNLDPDKYSDPAGYYVVWERCCRNASMTNVENDGVTVGMTYILEFPAIKKDGEPFVNSSPQLFPALSDYACVNQLYYASFAGTDADGDSLVYSLVAPLNSSIVGAPTPPPSPKPHFPVEFISGYSVLNMVPGNPNLRISSDGFLTVKPSFVGIFVFSVLVEEYRSRVKIGQVTRDFQMLVLDGCDPPAPPNAEVRLPGESQFYNEVDTIRFTVSDEKCFEFLVIDDVGEEVMLRAEGVNFTDDVDQIFDFEQGFINAAHDTLRVQVCVPECPYVRDIPYIIDLIASDNACPLPQLDTVRLIIDVQPPPNIYPTFQNTSKSKTVVVNERDIYSSLIQASDPDKDKLQARLEAKDFIPSEYGMSIKTTSAEAGLIDIEFVWDTDCQKYNFQEINHFDAYIIVDDNDFCAELDGDTIFYNLNVILPLNSSPVITSSSSNNIQIFQGDFLSIDIGTSDLDNDLITLGMVGNGFNPEELGVIFNDDTGIGAVSTRFEWDLDCASLGLTENSSFEFIFFSEDEDHCRLINSDTLRLKVDVLIPFNDKPVFDAYSDYELVVNEPFSLDIIASDLNGEFLNLDILAGSSKPPSPSFDFSKANGQNSVSSTLEWVPECSLLGNDYTAKNYTLFFLAWDNGCPLVKYDTLAINFTVQELSVAFDNFNPPNVFTPNGDGKNDTYTLHGLMDASANLPPDNCEDQFQSIVIIDRSGKQVYQSGDRNFIWTGNDYPSGVYYYYIEYLNTNYKGTITILQ